MTTRSTGLALDPIDRSRQRLDQPHAAVVVLR